MTRKYALEGGPGTGKSRTLEEIHKRGIYTMKEVAEYLIERELRKGGNILPWTNRDAFQKRLLETQLEWEREIPCEIEISFQDSGIPRGIAYYIIDGLEPPQKLLKAAKEAKYEKVFLLDPLPESVYKKTEIRAEEREKALRINEITKEVYKGLGIKTANIPNGSLDFRTELILDIIEYKSEMEMVGGRR